MLWFSLVYFRHCLNCLNILLQSIKAAHLSMLHNLLHPKPHCQLLKLINKLKDSMLEGCSLTKYKTKKSMLYILSTLEFEPHAQSSFQMLHCGHWLHSVAVRHEPLSPKPNNLLFSVGEIQAGRSMSDEILGY